VVAPDTGRVKTAKKLADRVNLPIAVLHKTRPAHNQAEVTHVVGEVKGKKIIIVDDIIDTGGSVVRGVEALIKHGATSGITIVCTHGVFSGDANKKLNHQDIAEVVATNSIPIPTEKRFPQLKTISAAPLLAEAIRRNYQNESISKLFD
jgi:ribose-phosphate pyrophosphokinase